MGLRDLKLRLRALIARRRVERDLDDELVVSRRARSPEADRSGHGAGSGAGHGAGALRVGRPRGRRMPRPARHRVRRRHHPRRPVRAPLVQARAADGAHDRRDRRGRPRHRGRPVHLPEQVPVPRRHGPRHRPDVRRRTCRARPTAIESPFTRPAFEALRRETSVFTDAYAAVSDVDLRVEGRMMSASLVTGNFFQVVRVDPVMGRALRPPTTSRAASGSSC